LSRVISAEEVPAGVGAFNLANFEQAARDIIARAEARAAEIAGQAKSQAQAAFEEARKEGYQAGHAEGLEEGSAEGRAAGTEEALAACRQDTSTLAEALEGLVAEFGARREGLVKDAERDLLALAMGIAERVVRRELAAGRGAPAEAVFEAISLASARSKVVARLNPADLKAVEGAHAEISRRFADMKDFRLVADESIARGGCLVTTDAGSVDLEMETQLERIESVLVGERVAETDSGPSGDETPGEVAE